MTAAVVLLTLVTLGRMGELWLAQRNTAALLKRGAAEHAADHYPLIVALHAAWLATLWLYGAGQPLDPAWLTVFVSLQAARAWVLISMGERWTTRILVVPGERLVARGPYRFVSHPNYIVVTGEILVLPLCLGLSSVALVFSALNAIVLMIRVRAEDAALRQAHRDTTA